MVSSSSLWSSASGATGGGRVRTVEDLTGVPAEVAKEGSAFRSSTAWRKLTPFLRMTQSIGPPPMPQPKQCQRFLAGVTTSEAVSSSWKGHLPVKSLPDFFSVMPEASTRRCTDTSLFSRSISLSGIRAINRPFVKTCQGGKQRNNRLDDYSIMAHCQLCLFKPEVSYEATHANLDG